MKRSQHVSRDQLAAWLDLLAGQATLIGPRWVESALLYSPLASSADLTWEFTRPVVPVKEVLFPPTERLLIIEKTGQEVQLNETLPEGRQVVFGVRPCEARGLSVLDAMFLENEPVDPYYARRRENTTLIGLACQKLGETCFCTEVGGAPDDPRDLDVMLAEVDGGYVVQAVTEKGRNLLHSANLPFEIVDLDRFAASDQPRARLNLDAWLERFDDEYWARLSEACLSCRICAYVCPTCRCFDIRDEVIGPGQYERLRCWDSCSGVNYRRIAGGHNPRPTQRERLRNRLFCKFYYYPKQYSLGAIPACTGCGRCVDYCPVGVDIMEVLSAFGDQVLDFGCEYPSTG